MTKDEIKHINFMYNRLTSVHKENPNVDYMKRFKEIIDKQLNLHVVVGELPRFTNEEVDVAYFMGCINVGGMPSIKQELKRLDELGLKPHEAVAKVIGKW